MWASPLILQEKAMGFSQKEPELANQLQVFAAGISANPALYLVTEPDALTIQNAVDAFLEALAVANNPATRNVGTIDEKEARKASALGVCRGFYRQIQNSSGVSNDAKLLIGVLPLNPTRTERKCPQSSPSILVVASTPAAHTVNYRDSIDPTRRGKPPGATMCQLFVEVGDENAQVFDPAKARFVGNFTSNPMPVVFEESDRGKQATYFARWGGKRNEFGQWSLPVSMTIAA
jgi:hypothetical protein